MGARVEKFLYTGVCNNPYYRKYQISFNLKELVESCDHSIMLSKLYLENHNKEHLIFSEYLKVSKVLNLSPDMN